MCRPATPDNPHPNPLPEGEGDDWLPRCDPGALAGVLLLHPGAAWSQSGGPTVTNAAISSAPASGDTYGPGETIRVSVTFSQAVDVSGAPRLKIKMDPNYGEKWAAYESGSGTTTLTFAHTVVEPNYSTQGIAVLANTLELNGGSIASASGDNAGLAHTGLAHTGLAHDASHKVDWQQSAPVPTPTPEPSSDPTPEPTPAPSVTGVAISSTPRSGDTYGSGETIRVSVTFSQAVNVSGAPRLKIKMDPNYGEKWAAYESGSGTTTLTFTHTVVEPNYSSQGIAVLANTLELNGGSIASASGDNAGLAHTGLAHDASHKVDWQQSAPAPTPTPEPSSDPTPEPTPAPSVTGIAVSSSPKADQTYALGETIRVRLTFSDAVDVSGSPRLKIKMAPGYGEKWATYASGSGTATLTFVYTVVEPNYSSQGIAVLADTLELNGGSIESADDTAAGLAHDGLAHDPNHKVNWELQSSNQAPVVSKPFHGIFSDPDGDQLTYSASIPDEHRHLLETLRISLDVEASGELWDILFFLTETETDWKALTPPLPDRVVVTATLTATDPGGLSASVSGDFLVTWESYPEVVSAVGREQAIELAFDWEVESNPPPAPEQFTVNVANLDGSTGAITVSSVSVSGKVVTLGLASELAAGQTVTLDYAYDWSDDTPLQRAGGGDPAPGFTGRAVDLSDLFGLSLRPASTTPPNGPPYRFIATWNPVTGANSYTLYWRQAGASADDPDAGRITVPARQTSAEITIPGFAQYSLHIEAD